MIPSLLLLRLARRVARLEWALAETWRRTLLVPALRLRVWWVLRDPEFAGLCVRVWNDLGPPVTLPELWQEVRNQEATLRGVLDLHALHMQRRRPPEPPIDPIEEGRAFVALALLLLALALLSWV